MAAEVAQKRVRFAEDTADTVDERRSSKNRRHDTDTSGGAAAGSGPAPRRFPADAEGLYANTTLSVRDTVEALRRLGMQVDVGELERLLKPRELHDLTTTKMTPELIDYVYEVYGVTKIEQLDQIFAQAYRDIGVNGTRTSPHFPPPDAKRARGAAASAARRVPVPSSHKPGQVYASEYTVVPFVTEWPDISWSSKKNLSLEGTRILEYMHATRTSHDMAIRGSTGPLEECSNANLLDEGIKCHRLRYYKTLCHSCWMKQSPAAAMAIRNTRYRNLARAFADATLHD